MSCLEVKNFGHPKCRSSLGRRVLEGLIPGVDAGDDKLDSGQKTLDLSFLKEFCSRALKGQITTFNKHECITSTLPTSTVFQFKYLARCLHYVQTKCKMYNDIHRDNSQSHKVLCL